MILSLCPNPSVDMYLWLPKILPGEVHRSEKEQRFPGGKGVHVALAVVELGEKVSLLGFWGGPSGQWIRQRCEEQGITCDGPEVEGWTRTCLSVKSESEFNETEILEAGPLIHAEDFHQYQKAFQELMLKADGITMSGSWPKGAPADGYAQLIGIAKQHQKKVFLDCTGEQLQHALAQKPFVVHLNKNEGASFFHDKDPEKMATLLARECEYAAVTDGAEGLYLASNGGTALVHAQCAVDQVYSSVGSGDCLLAGLAVAFKNNMKLEEAARLAVACGAANCIREDLGMLYRQDVEMLEKQVNSIRQSQHLNTD